VARGEESLQAIELELDVEEDRFTATGPAEATMPAALNEMGAIKVGSRFLLSPPSSDDPEDPEDPDEWTTLSVTDDILLTVRGKDAKGMPLVQKLIHLIRSVVGQGG
jgi:hypothetical protein